MPIPASLPPCLGDLFHIAAAVEQGANLFLTFDERQKKMAKGAGLTVKN